MVPPSTPHQEVGRDKQSIRAVARAARTAQLDKERVSKHIIDRVFGLPDYQSAGCVLWYVDVRTEARTRHALPDAVASEKKIVVPYCVDGELELFLLESMDELTEGMYGILEPSPSARDAAEKKGSVEDVDVILVPGLAFDPMGGRIGHGKGYYDKLLSHARSDCSLIGLAYECQIFEEIPMLRHDVSMDKVVTESNVYDGRGRRS